MDRRAACLIVAASPWLAAAAHAQARRDARVAWVSVDRGSSNSPSLAAFTRGMRELGWSEGRNLAIDAWWGEGTADRVGAFLPQIVARRTDVVVAQGGHTLRALLDHKLELPAVFTFSGDPVIGKVVASYARPGGNRTGITFFALELLPKRLELMKEALPAMKRVAFVASPLHAGEQRELDAAVRAAKSLGVTHDYHPVTTAGALDAALQAIAGSRADAILAFADAFTIGFADRFAAFSVRHRIPAVSGWGIFADRGNFMTYGPVLEDSYHRLATFVDRILKGAKPGDIPIELPTTVELVVNLRTAKAMNLIVPPGLLARANRVID